MGGMGEWRVHGFIFFLQVPAFQNITLRQSFTDKQRRTKITATDNFWIS